MLNYIFFIIATSIFAVAMLFFFFGYLAFLHTCKRTLARDPAARGYVNASRYAPHEKLVEDSISTYKQRISERICITSHDGITLSAAYLPAGNTPEKLIIFFHGYRSCAEADFACIACRLIDMGYSLIAVDQRAHGASDGSYITFGIKERYDCQKWCEYAAERFRKDLPIYLYGVSMGASTVLMASELDLPKNVKAIAADCGFTVPWEIVKRTLWRKHRLFQYPIIYFINYWARIFAHFDLREASCTDAVKRSSLPILLIHGTEDKYVPIEMSEKISVDREDIKLLKIHGAKHARSYLTEPERYLYELTTFFVKRQ